MVGPPHRKQIHQTGSEKRKDISIIFKMKDIEVNKNVTIILLVYYIINTLRMFAGLRNILRVARN